MHENWAFMELSTKADRVKYLRIEGPRGKLKQSVVAAAVGLSTVQYQRYEYGTAQKNAIFEKLASFYPCSLNWLLTGKDNRFPEQIGERPPTYGTEGFGDTDQPDFPPDEFIFVRQVRGKISAGGGLAPDDDIDVQLAFRKAWIKKKGSPGNMSLIKVAGDSMEPTLLSGDLVLVDHSRNSIASQGGIYAIAVEDEIMIKRVQPAFPDKVLVISDNKQYSPYEIAADKIRVNGKVIWYARDMER